jgi:hypothetical protein
MAAIVALAACSGSSTNPTVPGGSSGATQASQALLPSAHDYRAVCDRVTVRDWASCFALVRTDVGGVPGGYHGRLARHTLPAGYGPAQLAKAYNLNTSGGSGQTIALVEVGDYPTAAADLATYRTQFGLSACGTGCFSKVGQSGSSTSLPAENAGWAEESALDVEMVSAICPNCHIVMIEAGGPTSSDLDAAENEAAKLHATVISNSYGYVESRASDAAYSHAGIVITASAGDYGYFIFSLQPCSYATVVCAGGSSLVKANNARGYSETVWNDHAFGDATGSGCSFFVAKPSWQHDKGCSKRSDSDVSFDADPDHGVAVYDSTAYKGYSGWLVFGGTSVAAPALAAVYGLAGNAGTLGPNAAKSFWASAGAGLNSVTSGNNVTTSWLRCASAQAYICTAGTGKDGVYSGPTGWGTPDGTADF